MGPFGWRLIFGICARVASTAKGGVDWLAYSDAL